MFYVKNWISIINPWQFQPRPDRAGSVISNTESIPYANGNMAEDVFLARTKLNN